MFRWLRRWWRRAADRSLVITPPTLYTWDCGCRVRIVEGRVRKRWCQLHKDYLRTCQRTRIHHHRLPRVTAPPLASRH
jgi:hypothetical protein